MRPVVIFGAIAVSLVLASCSPSESDNPSPLPTAATSTLLSAPQVANPLEVSKFEQEPCTLITSDQAAQLAGFTETTGNTESQFPICGWRDKARNSVAFTLVRGNGLSDAYTRQDSESGYFAVAPDVAGYPAVFSLVHDSRNTGGCQIIIGVRNDVVLGVISSFYPTSPFYQDPCAFTVKAAELAVSTLKGVS